MRLLWWPCAGGALARAGRGEAAVMGGWGASASATLPGCQALNAKAVAQLDSS